MRYIFAIPDLAFFRCRPLCANDRYHKMRPVLVDSSQCHLWTDALHTRELARHARNKWDRGTYVRNCVATAWTSLETSCQDALSSNAIGYSFKVNLDKALTDLSLPAIDWSSGLWQQVRALQETRKSYVHRFLALSDMFPPAKVAEDAITTVREAVKDIYARAQKPEPDWVHIDASRGWDEASKFGRHTASQTHLGASFDDPNTTRVYLVIDGEEKLTSVFPSGHDARQTVEELVKSVNVPIEGIRVYNNGVQILDFTVAMRGN